MGQDLAGIVRQFAEQGIFDGRQVDFLAARTYLAVREVYNQTVGTAADVNRPGGIAAARAAAQALQLVGAAHGSSHVSEQFFHVERLRQVVVRAEVERPDFDRLFI